MAVNGKRVRKTRTDKSASSNKTKQMVVVALLFVMLGVALMTQPKSSDTDDHAAPAIQLTGLKLDLEKTPTIVEPHPSLVKVEQLASSELDQWIHHSPFAASHSEAMDNALENADGAMKVQAVYGYGSDAVALIGRRLVRQGETLPDGRRVISITAEGVELAR